MRDVTGAEIFYLSAWPPPTSERNETDHRRALPIQFIFVISVFPPSTPAKRPTFINRRL